MARTAYRARGRRRPATSHAHRQVRRRRFMVRRFSFVLTLFLIVVLFSFWVRLYGSSERVYTRAVSPQSRTFPEPPDPRQPDMGRVWDAAIARPEGNILRARAPRQGETRPVATDREGSSHHRKPHLQPHRHVRPEPEANAARAAAHPGGRGRCSWIPLSDGADASALREPLFRRLGCTAGVQEGRPRPGALPHTVDSRPERLQARWSSRGCVAGHRTRGRDRTKRGEGPGAALARHPQANCERVAAHHRPLREIWLAIRDRGGVAGRQVRRAVDRPLQEALRDDLYLWCWEIVRMATREGSRVSAYTSHSRPAKAGTSPNRREASTISRVSSIPGASRGPAARAVGSTPQRVSRTPPPSP